MGGYDDDDGDRNAADMMLTMIMEISRVDMSQRINSQSSNTSLSSTVSKR